MKMDPSKVEAILDWPTPRTRIEVRSFHDLAQFYRKFVRNFSGICATILETIKGGLKKKFKWIEETKKAFQTLKQEVAIQSILILPTFDKLFTIECYASKIVVGGVLIQEGRCMAFLVRNSMRQRRSIQLMTWSCMHWYNLSRSGGIISCLKNLLFILIIRL